MKILIADDDSTSRIVLDATLKKLGHQVITTTNGEEALAAYEQTEVPILITDIVMPGMDGLELCRRIRATNRLRHTYIILLTTVGDEYGYLAGMRAGVDDFVTKPFDEDQLTVRLVVAQRIINLQSQVKKLSGLLPICACCKKVRDDQNYWQQVETFITQRSDARFTHSYCPECFNKMVRDLELVPRVATAPAAEKSEQALEPALA